MRLSLQDVDGVSLGKWSPRTVNRIQVGVAQIQLAADQDDGRPRTEVLDLLEPHGADVAQGVGVCQREAQHHDIGPTEKGREGKGREDGKKDRGTERETDRGRYYSIFHILTKITKEIRNECGGERIYCVM